MRGQLALCLLRSVYLRESVVDSAERSVLLAGVSTHQGDAGEHHRHIDPEKSQEVHLPGGCAVQTNRIYTLIYPSTFSLHVSLHLLFVQFILLT